MTELSPIMLISALGSAFLFILVYENVVIILMSEKERNITFAKFYKEKRANLESSSFKIRFYANIFFLWVYVPYLALINPLQDKFGYRLAMLLFAFVADLVFVYSLKRAASYKVYERGGGKDKDLGKMLVSPGMLHMSLARGISALALAIMFARIAILV